jgi:hypothetical protein
MAIGFHLYAGMLQDVLVLDAAGVKETNRWTVVLILEHPLCFMIYEFTVHMVNKTLHLEKLTKTSIITC